MAFWELNPEVLGSLCLMASATLGGGESLRLKASMIGEGGRTLPLLNYTLALFAFQLRKSTENLDQDSRVAGDYTFRRLGRLSRDSLGWPAEHQSTSVTRG
jgi:hypothetical protein